MTTETKNRKTLADIASADGVFAIIAMDQRNTLRRMFKAVGIEASEEDLRTVKADVARALTPAASGMLLDPTYGVPAVTEAQALAPSCGLLVAAEPSSRDSYNGEPRTHRDPELNARWVAAQGGDAVKFLVQLRADRPIPTAGEPDLAREVLDVCREIVTDCTFRRFALRYRESCLRRSLANSSPARRAKMRSSTLPPHSTSSTSTSSNSSIPGHRTRAAAWRTLCTARGLCYRPESPSNSSVTSSRLRSTKGERPGSSPAGQSGARLFLLAVWNVNASWTASLVHAWTIL